MAVVHQTPRVVVRTEPGAAWLPARLRAFAALHPGIEVSVHAMIWAEHSDQIADLCITLRHAGQPVPGMTLQPEKLVVVCPPEFLHGPFAPDLPADVARKGMIHVPGRPDHWESFARHHGLIDLPPTRGPKTDSSNIALKTAIAALGRRSHWPRWPVSACAGAFWLPPSPTRSPRTEDMTFMSATEAQPIPPRC